MNNKELAEKVAVEVMGWKKVLRDGMWFYEKPFASGVTQWVNVGTWNPCNDWNDAMMLVKELEKDLIFFELKSYEHKNYVMYAANFYINNGLDRASVSRVIRKNPLEAITIAALKAKGVDVNER